VSSQTSDHDPLCGHASNNEIQPCSLLNLHEADYNSINWLKTVATKSLVK